ncbi:MAG: tetratricopeptide repeat protein [Pseudomonadota bacterium]
MFRSLIPTLAAAALLMSLALPAKAQSVAGPYLAARSAASQSDFEQAASFYSRALARDSGNPVLMESLLISQLSLGRISEAQPVAELLADEGVSSQVAELILTTNAIIDGDLAQFNDTKLSGDGIGPLVDGLVKAWANMGLGEVSSALEAFDDVAIRIGLDGFALYHKALALASVGDFEGAEAIFSGEPSGGVVQTRRGVLARAQVLSQLERNDDAINMIEQAFSGSTDPEIEAVIASLQAGKAVPFTYVRKAQDGLAEVFFSVAAALRNEAAPEFTLLYGQVAVALRPDHIDALLLTAELLETLKQYDAAISVYRSVPADNPAYHAAELGRADALRRSGREEAAIEVLGQLTRSHDQLATVHSALGDALRQSERFEEAVSAYDRAVELNAERGGTSWFLLYARAISYERTDQWELAEADFRAALELNPNQPQVLNYLGYSLVEQKVKLSEALEMIERAVAASPDSGYIVDSLGWALYRLGRFQEAVPHMERAVELLPVDPVVNDHLGDVYWAVGRTREAEFQWMRALSFVDQGETAEDADPDRIRRKLDLGLDQVLEEEGAPPLKVVSDDG